VSYALTRELSVYSLMIIQPSRLHLPERLLRRLASH